MRRAVPERSRWRGEDVHLDEVVAELDRLHRELQDDGRGQALARTLNLIVAPASAASREGRSTTLSRGSAPTARRGRWSCAGTAPTGSTPRW